MPTLLLLVLMAAASPSIAAEVSFARDVLPVLMRHCVMCHLPGAALGELELYPDAWRSVVDVSSSQSTLELVKAGEPDQSYFYLKLTGTHEAVGGHGQSMPIPPDTLDPDKIKLIRSWIELGAKNN